jgi:hypothetical protein
MPRLTRPPNRRSSTPARVRCSSGRSRPPLARPAMSPRMEYRSRRRPAAAKSEPPAGIGQPAVDLLEG